MKAGLGSILPDGFDCVLKICIKRGGKPELTQGPQFADLCSGHERKLKIQIHSPRKYKLLCIEQQEKSSPNFCITLF